MWYMLVKELIDIQQIKLFMQHQLTEIGISQKNPVLTEGPPDLFDSKIY
jgi:hypothetical protein